MRVMEEGDIIKLGRVRLKFEKIVLKQTDKIETNYHTIAEFNEKKNSNAHSCNKKNCNIDQLKNFGNNQTINLGNNIKNYEADNSNIRVKNTKVPDNFDSMDVESFSDEIFSKIKEGKPLCKICFRSYSNFIDPLISPCKCSGSMAYIHYKCLKQCINMKISTKTSSNYVHYFWKNFECEICLTEYLKTIIFNQYNYNLVDIIVNFVQYVTLEYITYDENKKKYHRKGIIVVKVDDEEEISIGRTQANKIKLKDISVSRMHCYLVKKNNKILACDKGSKFGTLLHINKPFILSNNISHFQNNCYMNSPIEIISGKHLFNFRLTKPFRIISNFLMKAFWCKCKSENEDECILKFDESSGKELSNDKHFYNNLNDSYCEYFLKIESIINNDVDSDNNSFI